MWGWQTVASRRDVWSDACGLIGITVVNITKRSDSALASTKKSHFGHFPITLSEGLWCRFGHYPSASVDLSDVKNLLSDRILTLFMAKLTICWGMCSASALEEMSSFLLYFILPLSLGLYMPYGCFTCPLHSILLCFLYFFGWTKLMKCLLKKYFSFTK